MGQKRSIFLQAVASAVRYPQEDMRLCVRLDECLEPAWDLPSWLVLLMRYG